MTATTHSTGDEPRENPGDATDLTAHAIAPDQDAGAVLVGAVSHLCSNCGAELATDQKYCVECGTRRGIPRFRVAGVDDHKADAPSHQHAAPVSAPAAISQRLLALLALIVVLAAIAVGFVIGNSGSSTTVRLTGVAGATTAKTSGSGSSTSGSGSSKSSSSSSNGSSCTKGSPGCKNGKQTGNFFGS